jgi:DnaJ homolog subfamily B member 6
MDSFSDPFFTPFQHSTFGADPHAHSHFGFTDPFILFDSIFGDGYIPRTHHFHHHDPYAHLHRGQPAFPYSDHRFREMNDFMDTRLLGPRAHPHMLPFPVVPRNPGPSSSVYHSQSVSYSGGVQESHMTSTVNGVTHKVWSRRDADVSHTPNELFLRKLTAHR